MILYYTTVGMDCFKPGYPQFCDWFFCTSLCKCWNGHVPYQDIHIIESYAIIYKQWNGQLVYQDIHNREARTIMYIMLEWSVIVPLYPIFASYLLSVICYLFWQLVGFHAALTQFLLYDVRIVCLVNVVVFYVQVNIVSKVIFI